jgi:fucose 4-O-acetylase-like acetyltransferase
MAQRIVWIDIAKGIGIFLVIVGHLISPGNILYHWICSFHMPLFFFLSGICLKNDRNYGDFIVRRMKSLLLPYLFFGILITIMELGLHSFSEIFDNLRIRLFNYGAMWFIPVLFVTELLFFPVSKINNRFMLVIILLISAVIGWKLSDISLSTPLAMSTCFSALFFYGLGFLNQRFIQCLQSKKYFLFLFTGIHIILLFLWNTEIVMAANEIPQPIINYSSAIVGLVAFCLASNLLTKVKWVGGVNIYKSIIYTGFNTLIILCLHMEFISYASTYIKPFFKTKLIYKGVEFLFVLTMCYISVLVINRYLPIMANKKIKK